MPGGWEEFFRFIGEPFAGPLWPVHDNRNPFEVLIPKLKAAAEKFDMVPVPQHPHFDPQPWDAEKDSSLSDALEPYFLRALSGPRYLLGGLVCRPLATTKESAGRFAIGCIEGSSWHKQQSPKMTFAEIHHCFHIDTGAFEISTGGEVAKVSSGETMYIPKGQSFSFQVVSRFARLYVFASGGGIVELLQAAGQPSDENIVPAQAQDDLFVALNDHAKQAGCVVEEA